jgi:hypothetical protein
MSTREEKEKQQQILESKRQMTNSKAEKSQRDKEVIALKAANQMLEDAKEKIREKWQDDPSTMDRLIGYIDNAEEQNIEKGRYQYNASEAEINNSRYNEVSKSWEEKYQKHLENKGITDEEMRAKSSDDAAGKGVKVIMSSNSKKEKEGKWFSFRKKKPEVDNNGEEIITEIDNTKRTQVGNGYIPDTDEDDVSPEKFMKEMEEKVEKQKNNPSNDENATKPIVDVNDKIEQKLDIKERSKVYEYPEFDPSTVNPLTRYDIIELPSHGECYAHKKGRIPVRELTASDENLIASPNMYANGQLIETILRRCILDKNFNVDEMCTGDRDAVVMWLRATAYGPEYNVSAVNPDNGKTYKSTINLSDFQFKPFDLKGDENGYFDYTFENGDVAKFKVLSFKETLQLQEDIAFQYVDQKKYIVHQRMIEIKRQVTEIFRQELADETLNDAIDYIYEWSNGVDKEVFEENIYGDFVTKNLIERTMSINGNDDRDYITEYVNSLRLSESRKYREYIFEHIPGIDFSYTIEIPESEGGGSINSFFQYEDTIFLS